MFIAALSGLVDRFDRRVNAWTRSSAVPCSNTAETSNLMRESVLGKLSPYTPAFRSAAGLWHRAAGRHRGC